MSYQDLLYSAEDQIATNTTNGHLPVPEDVAGVYTPRVLLDHYLRGEKRVYTYELVDEFDDPGLTDPEAHFGLLHRDFTPKPAFSAMKNLLGLLNDPGPAFTPTSIDTPPRSIGVRSDCASASASCTTLPACVSSCTSTTNSSPPMRATKPRAPTVVTKRRATSPGSKNSIQRLAIILSPTRTERRSVKIICCRWRRPSGRRRPKRFSVTLPRRLSGSRTAMDSCACVTVRPGARLRAAAGRMSSVSPRRFPIVFTFQQQQFLCAVARLALRSVIAAAVRKHSTMP